MYSYPYKVHAWLIHDSQILLFNVFSFYLILKLRCVYTARRLFHFCCSLVFDRHLLLFCYLLVPVSWKIVLVQSSREEPRKVSRNLNCRLWTTLKFNQSKLKTFLQSLRRYCVKNVRKNIFIKITGGGLKYINLFITFL